MKLIKSFFAFFFSKKFLSFMAVFCLLTGFSYCWEPFFALFARYDEGFTALWWAALLITAITLYAGTSSWRLAFGRSLVFASGIGAFASIIMMMLEGPSMAAAPVVFTVLAFAGSYPLINHAVPHDPHALDNLAAFSKHLKGFPDYYRNELQEWMHGQEGRREKAVRQMWIGLCFAIPASVLTTGAADYYLIPDAPAGSDEGSIWDWVAVFVLFLTAAITCGIACTPAWELKEEMKEKLLEKLSAYFGGLKYHKKLAFNPAKFREVGLIGDYNREETEEGFTGKHGHVDFILAETDIKKVTGSGKNRRTDYIFSGLMIAMSFPLPFRGRTLVLQDKGRIGNWLKNKASDLERVNLNIKQFEDKFEVYSTDQVETRAVLTPDLMENLIKLGVMFSGHKYDRLQEKDDFAAAKGDVELAFADSVLMIAIRTSENLFELGHLDANMEDTARIARFAREVGLIYEIIDTMELNRKAETLATVKAVEQ